MSTGEFVLSPIGRAIWEDRYALKDQHGKLIENSILDTFKRVALSIAVNEKDSKNWGAKFYELMSGKFFCPAGRILSNSGTAFPQLLNCYVIPFQDDSLDAIMRTARNMAVTQKVGGGTGFSYNELRPEGAYIKGVNGRSCGSIGFLDMMSVVSGVIEQGGCLTYDALIATEDGLLYLDELISDRDHGWHDHTMSVISKDGKRNSPRYYVNGYSKIHKIDTSCGISIKGTPIHKCEVFTEKGSEWKEFNEIKEGDWLVSVLGTHQGSIQKLTVDLCKNHHNNIVPDKLPDHIDTEFAFFLGYFLANGFSTENDHRFGVTIPVKSYLNDKIEGLYKNIFGSNINVLKSKKENDASTTYYVSNYVIKNHLSSNGLLKHKSCDASIPLKIRKSPPEVVGSFLSGLFEADGSVSHGFPSYSSASHKLIRELQALLFGIGIPSGISDMPRGKDSYSDSPMYRLRINSCIGLDKWNDVVVADPSSRLYDCKKHKPDLREKSYVLPYSSYWLKEALNSLPTCSTPEVKEMRKRLQRYLRCDRNLTISSYIELLNNPIINKYLPQVNNRYFSQVTKISVSEDYTADLEVDESHSYVANSIVSHNSRRGANLGVLSVDHPDIWKFISFKNDNNWEQMKSFITVNSDEEWEYFKARNQYKLQMYNISVMVNDEFLEAVEKDDFWPLKWGDTEWQLYTVAYKSGTKEKNFEVTADEDETAFWKVKRIVPYPKSSDIFEVSSKRKLKAREIWEKICYNAWANGCPGIVNISTIRKFHNSEYANPVLALNPCVTGDTLIAVADGRGAVPIKDLSDQGFDVPVYCMDPNGETVVSMMRRPRLTGKNEKIYKLILDDDSYYTLTGNHRILSEEGSYQSVEELKSGDSLYIHSGFSIPLYHNSKGEDYFKVKENDRPFYNSKLEGSIKIKSVEFVGYEDVYNGTVDEHHNYYLGGKILKNSMDRTYFLNSKNCGEQPLPGYGCCNLGAIVLSSFVKDGEILWDILKYSVHTAIRFLDDVIDICEFPLPEMKELASKERRIGLGTTGVHDLLIQMKVGYDTPEGRELVEKVLTFIRDEAYRASINLAKEKGAFPLFDKEKYLQSEFIKRLPEDIRNLIVKHGIRNVCLLSQAPVGTTGTMLNVSQGCEPWFAMSFERHTNFGSYIDGCQDYIKWRQEHPNEEKPPYFRTAIEITPEDHLEMMILFSKFVDSAVSKTVNLPENASVDDVKSIYMKAMKAGVKGITVFRQGCRKGVLESKDKKPEKKEEKKPIEVALQSDVQEEESTECVNPLKRGNRTSGATTRIHMQGHNVYVTVNKNISGNIVEVFATVGESKSPTSTHTSGVEDSWAEGLGKTISLALRAGVTPDSIIRNLKNIPSDKPVFTTIGDCESSELIPSPPHAIARVMEEESKYEFVKVDKSETPIRKGGKRCSNCGSSNVDQRTPTCYDCLDCGHSGCS